MCAALLTQAKRASKKPATWGVSISAALLFAAISWADNEHEKVQRYCDANLAFKCEEMKEIYAKKDDVARMQQDLEWLKKASEENNRLLKAMGEKLDNLRPPGRKR